MAGLFKKWFTRWQDRNHLNRIYYVSGDGDDLNDGKHPLTPWKSIQRLNQEKNHIRTEDQVLFKRGYSYLGKPFFSCRSGRKVKVGAYGSGSYPVFPDLESQNETINHKI